MLLSKMKDVELANQDAFQLKVKNHKIYFSIKGVKHVLGSKVYPLGKRNIGLFSASLTKKGEYYEVTKSLEEGGWKPRNGYCYSNSEILHHAFKEHQVDAKYYSGWLFVGDQYPIHHAWVVVDGNVYDIGINVLSQNKMREQIESGKNPYSDKCLKEVKDLESHPFPIQDYFVWGKVPKDLVYVGSEDTANGARVKYNKCMNSVPNHPSYKGMKKGQGDRINFKTKYQKALEDA